MCSSDLLDGDETVIVDTIKIKGNGTANFENLGNSLFRVREIDIPNGYTLITDNPVETSTWEGPGKAEFINRLNFIPPPPPPEDEPRIPEIPDRPDRPDIPERDIPEMNPEPKPDPIVPTIPTLPIVPTVPEIIVIPEPIPEAKPEPEPEVDAEKVVIAEPLPQAKPVATLPKTGAASPLMTSGFGTLLLAAGLFLRRKKR